MARQILTVGFLITIASSCTPVIQSQSSVTVTPRIQPTTTTAPGDEPTLVFFVSELGKFEAWMPVSGGIDEFTITQILFGKSVECSIIHFPLNSAGAIVQYCDLASGDIASLSANTILDEVRDTLKKEYHWKIDKEQRGGIDGSFPALTLSGEEDMRGTGYDGTFKARLILAKNRVYSVHMSVYPVNWCNCLHLMDQVVDSFYIDPTLSIPFEPTP